MLVGGVHLTADDVSWLEQEAQEPGMTRSELARRLCRRRELVTPLGALREVTARIDLGRHERKGRLVLPRAKPAPSLRRPAARVKPPTKAQESAPARRLDDLGQLTVHLIHGPSDRWHGDWSRVLDEHHYLGSSGLCGARLRYVILAHDEVVAAASFSSAALHVAARDEFIDWSREARLRNRHLVIAQSRFCLAVKCPNLASRVHGLLLSVVADDWQQRYGHRPVLVESFVDTERFTGTCYKAANWRRIGKTAGRGRQDRTHKAAVSIKTIWVYPLDPKWQEILEVEPVRKIDLNLDWAEVEWGSVDLGDKRLTRRLVQLGRARGEHPTASLPQACGKPAATKAGYRLLNHPEVKLDRLLSGHHEATLSRAASESLIFAIQDTTSLNYTTHPETEGLGPITSLGAKATLGMEVHSVLLANAKGTPLGVLDIQAWARDPATYGKSEDRDNRPLEEKESLKWLKGYEAADAAAKRLENTKVVVLADREADMFELFAKAVEGKAHLLIRALQPRRLLTPEGEVEGSLWKKVREEPVAGTMVAEVPRRSARPARKGKAAQPRRLARTATLELRFREVRIAQPLSEGGTKASRRSVKVWAMTATETAESAGELEPIDWLLLTTLPITSPEAAREKVEWYTRRWLIEVYHRTLKSGCGIENRQSMTANSLQAALAIDAVVAWRVMWLVMLGREVPDTPCSIFFEEHEWKALYCFVKQTKVPPADPPKLREALRMVAGLGGFLGRKGDGEPGNQTVWRGLERLTDIAAAFVIFISLA